MFKKKIIYISNLRLPTEKAHGIQIMKTCEALKKGGADIELWVANKRNETGQDNDVFDFYNISHRFKIRKLPVLSFLPTAWKLSFYIESFSFFLSVFFAVLRSRDDFIVYTRDEVILFLCFLTKRRIFWESHMMLRSILLSESRLRRIAGIITISDSLKNLIIEKYNVDRRKIITAHDAVDLKEFNGFLLKEEARETLGLPKDKNIVMYTGSIFKQKGVFVLSETAALFDEKWLFVIVGGGQGDESEKVKQFISKQGLRNIFLSGYIPHKEIIKYLAAADILVIPNSNLDERTKLFTSPLKLFEYMASGRPIVASATLTILEVLNDSNAVLVEPDNPVALGEGLLKIVNDKKTAGFLAQNARKEVENYTWEKRAIKILGFLEEHGR
mgnify:FL=1